MEGRNSKHYPSEGGMADTIIGEGGMADFYKGMEE